MTLKHSYTIVTVIKISVHANTEKLANVLCPSVILRRVPREGMSVHLHVVCPLVAPRRVLEEDLSVFHHYVWLLLGP